MLQRKLGWYVDNKAIAAAILIWVVVVIASTLPGCGALPSHASTTPVASSATNTANVATADTIEEIVTTNETNNETNNETIIEEGIPTHWFIIGALVFGMIIPQPRIIRWLF